MVARVGLKAKPKSRLRTNSHSIFQQDDHERDDGIQYLVSSKNKAILLSFEARAQRRYDAKLKAVRTFNQDVQYSKIQQGQQQTNGLQGSSIYCESSDELYSHLEIDDNLEERDDKDDEDDQRVYYGFDSEESQLEVEGDDDYYQTFLQTFHIGMAVKNLNQVAMNAACKVDKLDPICNDNTQVDEQESPWNLSGILKSMMYNFCVNECNDLVDFGDDDTIFENERLNEVVLSKPTALYAAIGAKKWNVALRRLIEKPNEAGVWVSSGTNEDESIIKFLPIHLACFVNAPLLLITLLVQSYPEGVEQEALGRLPIHMACQMQVDHRIIFLLLERFPESLNILDDEGNTPVDIASSVDSNEQKGKIIQVLTRKMENTVVTKPTTLYHAIDSQDWNSAMRRLVKTPQESTMWVSFDHTTREIRFLPLHAACLMGAPLLLVEDLIQAYPDAVRKKNTEGKLPLHLACEAQVDHQIVELLVDHYQESVHVTNAEGETPIEIAYKLEPSPERSNIIDVLASIEENDDNEEKIVFLPTKLYSLISNQEWETAVSRVLEAPNEVFTWVAASKKRTSVKCLPLHIACSLGAPLILVAVLVQSYPESVQKTTNSGKLPLHIACEARCSSPVVSLLLHSWPESYHVRDDNGQTCVQTALLVKPGKRRTKIVEVLTAFESKKPHFLQTVKDEKLDQLAIMQDLNDNKNMEQPELEDDDIVISRNESSMDKSKKIKPVYYTKKKGLFGRAKKSLWQNDEDMFE